MGQSDLKKVISSHKTGRVGADEDKVSEVKKPSKTTRDRSNGIHRKLTKINRLRPRVGSIAASADPSKEHRLH